MRFGRDKDGDFWIARLMFKPVEIEINHNDRSTTVRRAIWWVGRWHWRSEFTKSWRSDE